MGFKGILVFMAHSLGPLTYLQGRSSDADLGNGCVNQGGRVRPAEGLGLIYVQCKQAAGGNLLNSAASSAQHSAET